MLAARMRGYRQPLALVEIKIPEIFEDINENLEMLRRGDIIGRAVIVFDVKVNLSDRKDAKDATAPGRGASPAGSSARQG
jgi:hypothetical protein